MPIQSVPFISSKVLGLKMCLESTKETPEFIIMDYFEVGKKRLSTEEFYLLDRASHSNIFIILALLLSRCWKKTTNPSAIQFLNFCAWKPHNQTRVGCHSFIKGFMYFKQYSPDSSQCYFLQIHTKICSKVPIIYFNRPKRPP